MHLKLPSSFNSPLSLLFMYSDFTSFSLFAMSTSDPKPELPASGLPGHSKDPETTSSSSLGGLSAADGESDGFATPTESDKRIPEIRPCPPPPRKPTATVTATARIMRPNLKRKSSPDDSWSNRGRRTPILLDLSSEIESMFPPILRANLVCKIKKARSV